MEEFVGKDLDLVKVDDSDSTMQVRIDSTVAWLPSEVLERLPQSDRGPNDGDLADGGYGQGASPPAASS